MIEYDDEDTEEMYHNEVHGHRNQSKDPQVKPFIPSSTKKSNKK